MRLELSSSGLVVRAEPSALPDDVRAGAVQARLVESPGPVPSLGFELVGSDGQPLPDSNGATALRDALERAGSRIASQVDVTRPEAIGTLARKAGLGPWVDRLGTGWIVGSTAVQDSLQRAAVRAGIETGAAAGSAAFSTALEILGLPEAVRGRLLATVQNTRKLRSIHPLPPELAAIVRGERTLTLPLVPYAPLDATQTAVLAALQAYVVAVGAMDSPGSLGQLDPVTVSMLRELAGDSAARSIELDTQRTAFALADLGRFFTPETDGRGTSTSNAQLQVPEALAPPLHIGSSLRAASGPGGAGGPAGKKGDGRVGAQASAASTRTEVVDWADLGAVRSALTSGTRSSVPQRDVASAFDLPRSPVWKELPPTQQAQLGAVLRGRTALSTMGRAKLEALLRTEKFKAATPSAQAAAALKAVADAAKALHLGNSNLAFGHLAARASALPESVVPAVVTTEDVETLGIPLPALRFDVSVHGRTIPVYTSEKTQPPTGHQRYSVEEVGRILANVPARFAGNIERVILDPFPQKTAAGQTHMSMFAREGEVRVHPVSVDPPGRDSAPHRGGRRGDHGARGRARVVRAAVRQHLGRSGQQRPSGPGLDRVAVRSGRRRTPRLELRGVRAEHRRGLLGGCVPLRGLPPDGQPR